MSESIASTLAALIVTEAQPDEGTVPRLPAVVDFSALPPEINSARMYSGPGSGPLLAATSAWSELATELRTTETSYRNVVLALTDEEWRGGASALMADAAMTFVAWLATAARQAELTGAQTAAAVRAYETAFAAVVPPAAVADNRAHRDMLIATNTLGQNTPAIAVAEAQYGEMWAQDAIAMYGYASSSAAASRVLPFTAPPPITRADSDPAREVDVASPGAADKAVRAELISAIPKALQVLSAPRSGAGTGVRPDRILGTLAGGPSVPPWMQQLWANWGPNATLWDTIFSSAFFMPGNWLGNVTDFMGLNGGQVASVATDAADSALPSASSESGVAAHVVGSPVTAGLGKAASIGPLSVPAGWTAVPQSGVTVASTSTGTPMVAPAAAPTAMPGMPAGPPAGRPYGRPTPQYGFRPTFVTRPPSAG